MTIKEVCEKYDITADTLRYYERVGVIPTVSRTKGGIRDFSERDLSWVENAICMRNAGVPVEMLIEYVRLFQEGNGTFKARRDLPSPQSLSLPVTLLHSPCLLHRTPPEKAS